MCLTIFIRFVTCEWNLSAMCWIKAWLRIFMLQEQFADTFVLYIEKHISAH